MSIKLENVSFTYMQGTPAAHTALQNINLEIKRGEFVAIIGHTGSGKSTLVQMFNGLLYPDQGTVTLDDINLQNKTNEAKLAAKKVGMVFQYPEQQLFSETVYEDVAFAPRNKGLANDEIDKAVRDALQFVNLDFETFSGRNPLNLSGGQMRRIAIAGIIAMNPDYLILDEPSAGLDPKGRKELFKEIINLHNKKQISIILVTHSMEEAAAYAQRLLVLDKGKIVLDGEPQDLFINEREKLLALGLGEPTIYKLTNELKTHGLNLEQPNNFADLVAKIKQAKGWH